MVREYSKKIGKYEVQYVFHGEWMIVKDNRQIGGTYTKREAIKRARKLSRKKS